MRPSVGVLSEKDCRQRSPVGGRGRMSRVHPGSCYGVSKRSKVDSFKVDCVRAFIGHSSAHHRLDECTAAFFYVRADCRRPSRSVERVEHRARLAAAPSDLQRRRACRLELGAETCTQTWCSCARTLTVNTSIGSTLYALQSYRTSVALICDPLAHSITFTMNETDA